MRAAIICPKCQRERRPDENSCARCGLSSANWDRYAPLASGVLDDAWADLLTRWNDDDAHRRFLETAAGADALDVAAAHYRSRRDEGRSDARSEQGLRRSASLAENLYAARAQADRMRLPGVWLRVIGQLFAAVIVLGLVWVLLFVFTHRR